MCRQYLNPINDLNAPALLLDHLPVEEKDIVVYPTNYSVYLLFWGRIFMAMSRGILFITDLFLLYQQDSIHVRKEAKVS